MALFSVLGKAPAGSRLQRIEHSPNYKDGRFQNPIPTTVTLEGASLFKMLGEYRNRPADTAPDKPIPSVRTDLRSLPEGFVVWFGHSSYLLKINGLHILVDPVFSPNASPVSFMARAFPGTEVYTAADMPDLDVLLLTHDHYDHLDYRTVLQLAARTKHICTSLGVGAHLEAWGIGPDKITELDWGESWTGGAGGGNGGGAGGGERDGEGGFTFTATPARHFSGRTFKRAGTLWSSFVLKTGHYSIFLGGDSGYGEHFSPIGDRYGPFDLAILECGQYGKNWPYIHMLPEETVQAALDLRAAALLPVHWSKFTLALHPWNEPPRRVTAAAAEKGLPLATPLIGQPVPINGPYPGVRWWE
ncbi:MAG TPA: MBL fold metallo-hydrolase [Puia sp.]|jgi:L-ascorbate metabolism protein UlaG (beta-lactamase superfamily)|nr:MBL fold metallo-hydrolase [Puia sp.]